MTVATLLALLSSVATGFMPLCRLWPERSPSSHFLLKLSLATGLGLGLSSVGYFIALLLFDGARFGVVLLDAALLLVAGALYFLAPRPSPVSRVEPRGAGSLALRWILAASLCVEFASAAATCLATTLGNPHGGWDAWAIWNLRARFLFRGGPHWVDAFSSHLMWSHPDYPLLLPTTVARLWTYFQSDQVLVPASVSALLALATVGLTCASLTVLRSGTQGVLAALCLLACPDFVSQAALQYADIPLGYFFLATLVLLACDDRFAPAHPGFALAAGGAAGCAAWTKNEGLLFVLSIVVGRVSVALLWRKPAGRRVPAFVIGALPALVIAMLFKLLYAPHADLLFDQGWKPTVAKLADLSRHWQVARAVAAESVRFGGGAAIVLVGYFLLSGRTVDRETRLATAAVAAPLSLVLAGLFVVYVITPYELTWHLSNSLPRLFVQLWPSVVFASFLGATTLEEAARRR